MGLEMAGRTRHLKEKDGRFYARVAPSLSIEQLAIKSYRDRLRQDSILRASSGGAGVPIDTDYAALLRDGMAGRLTVEALDELVGHRIQGFLDRGDADVQRGFEAWQGRATGIAAIRNKNIRYGRRKTAGRPTSNNDIIRTTQSTPGSVAQPIQESGWTYFTGRIPVVPKCQRV